jgi:hypothetical protein
VNAVRSTVLFGAWLAAAGVVSAASPRPLPAFEVVSTDGTVVQGASLTRTGHWLLVYVSPESAPSRTFLASLAKARPTGAGTVVVVAGKADEARTFAARHASLRDVAWYADPQRQAQAALEVTGVPVVFGLRDGVIEWSAAGKVGDEGTLKGIVASW